MLFQSTPSVKRVTTCWRGGNVCDYISIHTLCEEGDILNILLKKDEIISIHTLCEEGDMSRH